MKPPLLQIRGLTKSFGVHGVLNGLDLDLETGSVTTVIGRSGIGKSVLLKCIAGIVRPDGGEILLDGASVRGPLPGCCYMFQNNALFDSMTVEENVALPLHEATLMPKREIAERTAALLDKLDLTAAARQYPPELSGGMLKRVAFARALAQQPRLVLFDEPTTGLDPLRRQLVFELIRRHRQEFGFTVLIVSHDVPQVFGISDRVAWLENGRIGYAAIPSELAAGAPHELRQFLDIGSSETMAAVFRIPDL